MKSFSTVIYDCLCVSENSCAFWGNYCPMVAKCPARPVCFLTVIIISRPLELSLTRERKNKTQTIQLFDRRTRSTNTPSRGQCLYIFIYAFLSFSKLLQPTTLIPRASILREVCRPFFVLGLNIKWKEKGTFSQTASPCLTWRNYTPTQHLNNFFIFFGG